MKRAAATLLLAAAALATARAAAPPLRAGVPVSRAAYDRKGRLLRLEPAADGALRLWRPLAEMAPELAEATLLHEDRHFRRHPGVDPGALLRAAWLTYGRRARRVGGSTVTMQLARMRWGLDSSRPAGKLLQMARALQLEALYSKDEILEAYLNLAPYGGVVEGAGAASLAYFGKDVSRLDLSECVTLAVIPQNPVRRTLNGGRRADEAAREAARRRLFAAWTARHPEDASRGAFLESPWRAASAASLPRLAPHFTRRVLASSSEERVATTLDLDLQRLLERLVSGHVERGRDRGIRNAGALLVDFTTMETLAAVGSADWTDARISGEVSALTARRSPGSTLKPFIYGLAYEQGLIHPRTLLKDAPTAFGAFNPENFDGSFAGPLPAREALVKSRNIPAVELTSRLNAPGLYGFLKDAGVRLDHPPEHYGLGLALGAAEVSMEDLARLYASLGNGGALRPLRRRLGDPVEPGRRLLTREAVALVMEGLADNPRPRQAFRDDWRREPLPVYWKTGTSWGFRDAWSAGVFGRYVLVVWIGNFDGQGDPAFVGAEAAAPLFFDVVDALRAREPLRDAYAGALPPPAVAMTEVCAVSGGTPGAFCPRRVAVPVIPGVSPIAACAVHREVLVDAAGRRACRREGARAEVFEFWPSDLLRLFRQAGIARRVPPPDAEACALTERAGRGSPPAISSPLAGVTYYVRAGGAAEPIPFSATADADARELWWFVDGAFAGRSSAGKPFFWAPRPGHAVVRVVDDQGRADARELDVAMSE